MSYELGISYWSSDVCSSDLHMVHLPAKPLAPGRIADLQLIMHARAHQWLYPAQCGQRVDELNWPGIIPAKRDLKALDHHLLVGTGHMDIVNIRSEERHFGIAICS